MKISTTLHNTCQENEFFHKIQARQQNISEQIQIIKQESHKTKIHFFTHLHLYQTKFNYMINFNKFNVYTTEIERILNLALKQDSNIHITTDTIFIKSQVLKYNKLNTITFNCIPNTEGIVFNLHSITHKNGTILDVTFINHKKTNIIHLTEIQQCDITKPAKFHSIIQLNNTCVVVISGTNETCHIQNNTLKFKKIPIQIGKNYLKITNSFKM